jgi:hypothetical protein
MKKTQAVWKQENLAHVNRKRREWRSRNYDIQIAKERQWCVANADKRRKSSADWKKRNPEKNRQIMREWLKTNRGRLREMSRDWKRRNPERTREQDRKWKRENRQWALERNKRWKKANPEKVRAFYQRRYGKHKGLLHPMHDRKQEVRLARECIRRKKKTGVAYVVDHIIPLSRGGWHHHLNLQILTRRMNSSKIADPFWEQKGFKSWRDVPVWLWPKQLAKHYHRRMKDSG